MTTRPMTPRATSTRVAPHCGQQATEGVGDRSSGVTAGIDERLERRAEGRVALGQVEEPGGGHDEQGRADHDAGATAIDGIIDSTGAPEEKRASDDEPDGGEHAEHPDEPRRRRRRGPARADRRDRRRYPDRPTGRERPGRHPRRRDRGPRKHGAHRWAPGAAPRPSTDPWARLRPSQLDRIPERPDPDRDVVDFERRVGDLDRLEELCLVATGVRVPFGAPLHHADHERPAPRDQRGDRRSGDGLVDGA